MLLCINHNCYLYMPSWGPDLVNKLISISILCKYEIQSNLPKQWSEWSSHLYKEVTYFVLLYKISYELTSFMRSPVFKDRFFFLQRWPLLNTFDCILNEFNLGEGPGWLNELGRWIWQLIQAYHQYGVGSRPALQITKRVHSTHSCK